MSVLAVAKKIFNLLRRLFFPPALKLESPIEEQFWQAAKGKIEGLTPQFQVARYHIDFAIPKKMIAIELDGHDYHSSKKQRTADAKRERFLQEHGWFVIRFTGSEIFGDVHGCVAQTIRIINKNRRPI